MTIRENIKAILDCNFSIVRDEYIEVATNKILEVIDIPSVYLIKANTSDDKQKIIDEFNRLAKLGIFYPMENEIIQIDRPLGEHERYQQTLTTYCPKCGAIMRNYER